MWQALTIIFGLTSFYALAHQLRSGRPSIDIRLDQVARIAPGQLDLGGVTLRLGKRSLHDIWALDLTVRNWTWADFENPRAANPTTPHPTITLPPGFKAIANPFVENPSAADDRVDVRVARYRDQSSGDQKLTLYIHQMPRRSTVQMRVVCTNDNGRTEDLERGEVEFAAGGVLHVELQPTGLLRDRSPWWKQKLAQVRHLPLGVMLAQTLLLGLFIFAARVLAQYFDWAWQAIAFGGASVLAVLVIVRPPRR